MTACPSGRTRQWLRTSCSTCLLTARCVCCRCSGATLREASPSGQPAPREALLSCCRCRCCWLPSCSTTSVAAAAATKHDVCTARRWVVVCVPAHIHRVQHGRRAVDAAPTAAARPRGAQALVQPMRALLAAQPARSGGVPSCMPASLSSSRGRARGFNGDWGQLQLCKLLADPDQQLRGGAWMSCGRACDTTMAFWCPYTHSCRCLRLRCTRQY
jgi:hypothetical protein